MTTLANNRQPMPQRSLFSFTRKRVFDSLCQRVTRFCFSNPGQLSSTLCDFAWSDTERLLLNGHSNTKMVCMWHYTEDSNNYTEYLCFTQAEVNKALVTIFAIADATCWGAK